MSGKARKSLSSSSSSKANSSKHVAAAAGSMVDERFVAAITRPQFHKAKRSSSSSSNNNHHHPKLQQAGHDEVVDHTIGGLGESLTQAIRSDDRFSAAILDSDKFGCVPDRDKYGRKMKTSTKKKKNTKKKKKKKDKTKENENDLKGGYSGGTSVNDEEEEDYDDTTTGEDTKKVNNKVEKHDYSLGVDSNDNMEARIAYLNALSRGDISGSSSSDDSSADNDDDDDDDSSTSSSINNIQGTSGIFDPSHKSLLPGNVNYISEGDTLQHDDETDEPSPYLCILNLNWEHIRAVDVYAMLHSFCPPGTLKKVEVYPSDFGRERMEKERVEGPPSGIWKNRVLEKKKKKRRDPVCSGKEEDEEEEDEEEEDEEENTSGNDVDEFSSDEFSSKDSGDIGTSDQSTINDDEEDDDEDVLDLADATSKLYAHFPPQSTIMKHSKLQHDQEEDEGFDTEKLREYEASKLRYYFAIATFSSSAAASQVYDNIDGIEMEDSAAEIDVRVLPQDQYMSTIQDRAVRDSCNQLPAKYHPPENAVATALKQSRVTCSWERGDADRERMLTRYGMGKEAWEALATGEDIKFYLATSDNSGCSSSDDGDGSEDEYNEGGELKSDDNKATKKKKGSSMRKLLGLATSDSEEENDGEKNLLVGVGSSDDGSSEGDEGEKNSIPGCHSNKTKSELESNDELIHSKEVAFVPGKQILDEKFRAKIKQSINKEGVVEVATKGEAQLSPFQKYLQRRKEKKKERRQASRKTKTNNGDQHLDGGEVSSDDLYVLDPEFGLARFSDEEPDRSVGDRRHDDKGFIPDSSSRKSKQSGREGTKLETATIMQNVGNSQKAASSRKELELLLAGDDDEEHNKDYDMRGLTKLERHSNKKLKGRRKRQLESLVANVSGQDFHVDASDNRFAALLDGKNDLYSIDRTHPAFRETSAMKELLEERSKRRKKERESRRVESGSGAIVGNGKGEEWRNRSKNQMSQSYHDNKVCDGAIELSSLVKSIQQKVTKT